MPAHAFPKSVKRHLRQLANETYENELAKEMTKLAEQFEAWKQGHICAGDLNILIHDYHQGPSREMFARYNSRLGDDVLVAGAIARGLLKRDDIPEEVWPHIQGLTEFYRSQLKHE